MDNEQVKTNDDAQVEVEESSIPERIKYRVLSESGLFKNGKQYEQGEIVELDSRTARNFLYLGEVEEVNE